MSVARTRVRLALRVGHAHGLRASEIVNLTDDNFRNGALCVQRLKGSNATRQPMEPDLYQSCVALVESLEPKAKLFPWSRFQFYRIFRAACKRAGIAAYAGPHMLKHSIALAAINGGAKINEIAGHLGHKNPASTLMYTRITDAAATSAVFKAVGKGH